MQSLQLALIKSEFSHKMSKSKVLI